MVRGGYFCTAGYTEVGGIEAFLKKLAPHIAWQRCFPAVHKPGPKLGRGFPEPQAQHAGVTGRRLFSDMLRILSAHHSGSACQLDVVVLIDDADCRFAGAAEPLAEQLAWEASLTEQVRTATGNHKLSFHALLAWPEVEAWFLADWDNSFGHRYDQYHQVAHPLRRHIETCILHPLGWNDVERFGGRLLNGSCEQKLSTHLQNAFTTADPCRCHPPLQTKLSEHPYPLHYSKRQDGPRLLARLDPAKVAHSTPHFRRPYNQIQSTKSP